jgi:hypothetical protein
MSKWSLGLIEFNAMSADVPRPTLRIEVSCPLPTLSSAGSSNSRLPVSYAQLELRVPEYCRSQFPTV